MRLDPQIYGERRPAVTLDNDSGKVIPISRGRKKALGSLGADANGNPYPGEVVREGSVFVIGLNPGDSAATLASTYTIGGWAYGEALKQYNGWDWSATDGVGSRAKLAIIPADWMKPVFVGQGSVAGTILDNVTQDAGQVADETGRAISDAWAWVENTASSFGTAGKWIVGGLVAVVALEILSRLPRARQ